MSGRVTIAIPDTPPSQNKWRSSPWQVSYRDKKRWQAMLNIECHRHGLPKCDRIEASVTFRFADDRRRDHDNYVSTLSKCLGDALRPDFIADDDSSRFQVVHGQISPTKGPKETIILLDWSRESSEAAA